MTKKILSFLLLLTIPFCFSGCGNSAESLCSSQAETTKEAGTSKAAEITEVPQDISEIETDTSKVHENSEESKILVVYFSATGTTKVIAEAIADEACADIFEIVPAQPYSEADLNYNDDSCRANKEQNDSSARPEISDNIEYFAQYDTIIIGHPIWWGIEPRIIDTFMESYDFSGKNVAHFCTSGGSGISSSDSNLQAYCSDSNWLGSKRFFDKSEVSDWLMEIELK